MINVVIDPMMLSLTDEDLIRANIDFYIDLFELLDRRIVRICTYPDMETLMERVTEESDGFPPPFPVADVSISDSVLRRTAIDINRLFCGKVLNNKYRYDIDIADCGGPQSFIVTPRMDDKDLENLCFYLLSDCYNNGAESQIIDTGILSGRGPDGDMLRRNGMEVVCSCQSRKAYRRQYHFVLPQSLFTGKENARQLLKDRFLNGTLKHSSPELHTDGTHSNYLQLKQIRNYGDLSQKNKSVLRILEDFGLLRIELHRTVGTQPVSGMPGEIIIREDQPLDSITDRLCAFLYSESRNMAEIELYFSDDVGRLIVEAIGLEWSQRNVRELRDSVLI